MLARWVMTSSAPVQRLDQPRLRPGAPIHSSGRARCGQRLMRIQVEFLFLIQNGFPGEAQAHCCEADIHPSPTSASGFPAAKAFMYARHISLDRKYP